MAAQLNDARPPRLKCLPSLLRLDTRTSAKGEKGICHRAEGKGPPLDAEPLSSNTSMQHDGG